MLVHLYLSIHKLHIPLSLAAMISSQNFSVSQHLLDNLLTSDFDRKLQQEKLLFSAHTYIVLH